MGKGNHSKVECYRIADGGGKLALDFSRLGLVEAIVKVHTVKKI